MNDNGITYQMVFYDQGFFGYGAPGSFTQWSLAHFAPILFTIVAVVLTWRWRERIRAWRHEETARYWYVFIMLMVGMSYYWRLLYVGPQDKISTTFMDRLPLQVCEWTLVICCFMMLKKSPLLFDMTYFLTMSFSLLPLAFPAVITNAGPLYYRYYQFWGEHLLPIYGMFYMMFVHRMTPHLRGIALSMGMLVLLAIPALFLNQAFEEANYLYLKPGAFEMIAFLPKSLPILGALYVVAVLALMGLAWLVWKLFAKVLHLNDETPHETLGQ